MAAVDRIIERLKNEKTPFSRLSRQGLIGAVERGNLTEEEANKLIDDAIAQSEGRAPPQEPPDITVQDISVADRGRPFSFTEQENIPPARSEDALRQAGLLSPTEARILATMVRDGDPRLTPSKRRNAILKLQAFKNSKTISARQESRDVAPDRRIVAAQQQAAMVADLVATNPVGSPVPLQDPNAQTSLPGGLGLPPRSDDPKVLANQAQAGGVDITTGFDDRFGLGLANYKDAALQAQIVDLRTRQSIKEAGITVPDNMPVVFVDDNTGKLAYLRPITEADVDEGDDPNNVGRLRVTLANPPGAEFGDIKEFFPNAPILGAEIAGGIASAILLKTPQAALATSSAITGAVNALGTPLRDKLLKDIYGFTDEEIAAHSDPNEALKNAAIAGGGELAFGGLISAIRAVRNRKSKRFLTEEDFDEIVAEQNAINQVFQEFRDVTGVQAQPSNELVAAAAGVRSTTRGGAELSIRAKTKAVRQGPTALKGAAAANLDTRLKVAAGYQDLTNRTVLATDPDNLANLNMQRGIVSPDEAFDSHQRALSARDQMREAEGLVRGQTAADEALFAEEEALNVIANRSNPQRFVDVQVITDDVVRQAQTDATAAWDNFRQVIETNSRGEAGIVLDNKARNTALRKAKNRIERDGLQNLSERLGEKDLKLVDDLASLDADTVDIRALHRLQSQLKKEQRTLERNPQNLGYDSKSLQQIIDAIDTQLQNGRWVRAKTGRVVPAVKRRGLEALAVASDATLYMKTVAQKDSIRALTLTEPIFNDAGRRVDHRFINMPGQVRDKLFSDATAMRDVLTVTGNNPQVRAGMATELEALYRRMVYPDGQFKAGLNQQFRLQYGDHMDLLFGPEQASKIRNVETFTAAKQVAQDNVERLENLFRENFGALFSKGDSMAPDHLIGEAMQSSQIDASQLRNLMSRIDELDPSLAVGFRAEMAQWMTDRAVKGPILKSGNAMRALLNDKGAKIGAVMGGEYVSNLRSIANALDILDAGDLATRVSEPIQAQWLQLTRSVFGPLSRKQRFMTALNRFQRNRGSAKALEIMADPAKLSAFVTLGRFRPETLVAQSIIANLALNPFAESAGIEVLDDPQRELPRIPGFEDFNRFGAGAL